MPVTRTKTPPPAATNGSEERGIVIKPPRLREAGFVLVGLAPLVQNKFSEKSRRQMMETQAAGPQSRSKRVREPKNFDAVFHNAIHYSEEGWIGIPAPAFRAALISACRLVGFKMTIAKLSVFVLHDGLDRDDGTPLVRLIADEPERHEASVRNESGVADVRVRPMWRTWKLILRVRWDEDQFSLDDVVNLLKRAGMQVGIGEGRPDSRQSAGMGWGTFDVGSEEDLK
jgi:hypothetical protein